MKHFNLARTILFAYIALFFAWQIFPLLISAASAFNEARFPSVIPWRGTTLRWFSDMWQDKRLWHSVVNTAWVALAVAAISVPLGAAGGVLLSCLAGPGRGVLFAILLAPFLTPEAVTGISTLVFWTSTGMPPGLHLSSMGQASGTATFVMLLVLARLQSFNSTLEEAALDLGATHGQVIRHILLPHITPALIGGGIMSMLLSIQNYNVTLFTRGTSETLMIYIGMLAKTGVTPKINALAFLMMSITFVGLAWFEVRRRAAIRREEAADKQASIAALAEEGSLH